MEIHDQIDLLGLAGSVSLDDKLKKMHRQIKDRLFTMRNDLINLELHYESSKQRLINGIESTQADLVKMEKLLNDAI